MSNLEMQFQEDMLNIFRKAKKIGYTPLLYLRMIGDYGGLGTAQRLLATQKPSDGFTRLWELKRLDLTVEALIIDNKEKYKELFSEEELEIAYKRLDDLGYFKGITNL